MFYYDSHGSFFKAKNKHNVDDMIAEKLNQFYKNFISKTALEKHEDISAFYSGEKKISNRLMYFTNKHVYDELIARKKLWNFLIFTLIPTLNMLYLAMFTNK